MRSILSVADRVLDQRRDAEAMAVPILLRRLRIGKVHMPAAAHIDRAAGFPALCTPSLSASPSPLSCITARPAGILTPGDDYGTSDGLWYGAGAE